MRIGVLEWASCGGMGDSTELSDSIRQEGWAMCRAALESLVGAGHQAVALVDPGCASDARISGYRAEQLELTRWSTEESVWSQWQEVYAGCDYTLVIAPECDHILERLLGWCEQTNVRTCNCASAFVRQASDKLRTAEGLLAHQLPHPPTQLLANAQREWIARAASQWTDEDSGAGTAWVIKPRDGVGCQGALRVTDHALRRSGGFAAWATRGEGGELDPDRWIVQPWIAGEAYSRSAIADRAGRLHWLPVTRQHLSVGDRITYLGGSTEPELAAQIGGLDELLTRAVEALDGQPRGWVGVDFLYDASNLHQPVTIIEINPRLTTSFVGLARAGAPDLAAKIIAATDGQSIELPAAWQRVRFTAAGANEPI